MRCSRRFIAVVAESSAALGCSGFGGGGVGAPGSGGFKSGPAVAPVESKGLLVSIAGIEPFSAVPSSVIVSRRERLLCIIWRLLSPATGKNSTVHPLGQCVYGP